MDDVILTVEQPNVIIPKVLEEIKRFGEVQVLK